MEVQIGDKIKWNANGKECVGCFIEELPNGKISVISHRVGKRVWNQNFELDKKQIELV